VVSNGSGVIGKAPTQLEIATRLGRRFGYQIGYYRMVQNFYGGNFTNGHLENFDKEINEIHNVNAHIYKWLV